MYNIKVVAPLRYFELDKLDHFTIGHFTVTKDQHILNRLIHNPEFLSRIGLNNMDTIFSNHIFYYEGKSESIDFLTGLIDQNQITYIISKFIRASVNNLWFVKDNSCFITDCFVQFDDKEVFNILADGIKTNCNGEFKTTIFNSSDLISLLRHILLSTNILKINSKHLGQIPKFDFDDPVVPNLFYKVPYDHNRLVRALLLIQKVQLNGFAIIKLTFYMATFEALFSSSDENIVKNVSERTSIFLGGDLILIQENIAIIKKAYAIRSRYIHGDIIKKNSSYYVELCKRIDYIAREILLKIMNDNFDREIFQLSNSKSDKSKFNTYFDELLSNCNSKLI